MQHAPLVSAPCTPSRSPAHHGTSLQIQALEGELQRAHAHSQELEDALDRQKDEAKDERTKDTLRFQILLDMFSLQALQNAQAEEIEEGD